MRVILPVHVKREGTVSRGRGPDLRVRGRCVSTTRRGGQVGVREPAGNSVLVMGVGFPAEKGISDNPTSTVNRGIVYCLLVTG